MILVISSKRPNKAEKHWHDWLKQQQCPVNGKPNALHHCIGSTAKHKKIHIGQWFCVGISYEAHQGPQGIHSDKSIFPPGWGKKRLEIEKFIFSMQSLNYENDTGEKIPAEVIDAIMDYHK